MSNDEGNSDSNACIVVIVSENCRLKEVAGPSLSAFVIGALGTVVGTLVAWALVGSHMGPEGSKVCTY